MDNLRYDQWRMLSAELSEYFTFEEELYYSILPTATQYSRNAIFSGLMPDQISNMFPELWVDEDSEEGKNLNEAPLIQTHLDRYRRKNRFSYNKVNDSSAADKLMGQINNTASTEMTFFIMWIKYGDRYSVPRHFFDSKMTERFKLITGLLK